MGSVVDQRPLLILGENERMTTLGRIINMTMSKDIVPFDLPIARDRRVRGHIVCYFLKLGFLPKTVHFIQNLCSWLLVLGKRLYDIVWRNRKKREGSTKQHQRPFSFV